MMEMRLNEEKCSNEFLTKQLERLWNTDFGDTTVEIKAEVSVENKRALDLIKKSLMVKDGHYQVTLPWREDPPDLKNNR